jgi:hypothetical protein
MRGFVSAPHGRTASVHRLISVPSEVDEHDSAEHEKKYSSFEHLRVAPLECVTVDVRVACWHRTPDRLDHRFSVPERKHKARTSKANHGRKPNSGR